MAIRILIVVAALLFGEGSAFAQSMLPKSFTSHSGQFLAQSINQQTVQPTGPHLKPTRVEMAGAWALLMVSDKNDSVKGPTNSFELDPTLLPSICERIKGTILFNLGLNDNWMGRISLIIDHDMPLNADPVVRPVREASGFRFELRLPAKMKPHRLAFSLTHVILLEMANRKAGPNLTRVPTWLIEGMVGCIQAEEISAYLLQANRPTPYDYSLARLKTFKANLKSKTLLTFQDLSWPRDDQLIGAQAEAYQNSAQLFVFELLDLNNGRKRLSNFIFLMKNYLNWQVAFLEAYSGDFTQLRDVEKWWSLACLNVSGLNYASLWSDVESGHKLQNALDVPVNVHLESKRMPTSAVLSLQEVIMTWQPMQQREAVLRVYASIQALRPHLSQETRPILDKYCHVIEAYMKRHTPSYLRWARADRNSPRFRRAICKELDGLDRLLAVKRTQFAQAEKNAKTDALKVSTRQNTGLLPASQH